jgi:hypothetical protein
LKTPTVAALGALAVAVPALGGVAPGVQCRSTCFVEVESGRFKAVGAGAEGSTLTLRVGARVTWRLVDRARHSVVASNFDFLPGDARYSMRPSAGRYDYRDTLGGAGAGTLVVHPRFVSLGGGTYEVTWGPDPIPPPDRVHSVRWFLIRGAEIVDDGTWATETHESSRTFRGPANGSSFCVEVRTGRGSPTHWSGWANACIES